MGKQQKSIRKSYRKLERKKELVLDWLNELGVKTPDVPTLDDILEISYLICGRTFKPKGSSPASYHAHFACVMQWAGITKETSRLPKPERPKAVRPINTKQFYNSYEWRKLRYTILKRDNQTCQACGAKASNGAVLHVDHIKPLRKYWSLRLDPNNLQTLCNVCNHGKGNWDQTDWRKNA